MDKKDFVKQIELSYKNVFPDSYINVKLDSFQDYQNIYIKCFLALDKTEVNNRIMENDIFNIFLHIGKYTDRSKSKIMSFEKSDKLDYTLYLTMDRYAYKIKSENKYYAFNYRKLKCRSTKGMPDFIIQKLQSYFIVLKDNLMQDYDNNILESSYLDLVRTKIKKDG